jgi:hypothetical protein
LHKLAPKPASRAAASAAATSAATSSHVPTAAAAAAAAAAVVGEAQVLPWLALSLLSHPIQQRHATLQGQVRAPYLSMRCGNAWQICSRNQVNTMHDALQRERARLDQAG